MFINLEGFKRLFGVSEWITPDARRGVFSNRPLSDREKQAVARVQIRANHLDTITAEAQARHLAGLKGNWGFYMAVVRGSEPGTFQVIDIPEHAIKNPCVLSVFKGSRWGIAQKKQIG